MIYILCSNIQENYILLCKYMYSHVLICFWKPQLTELLPLTIIVNEMKQSEIDHAIFFLDFSTFLVTNCTPPFPITHIAVDTPQRPRRRILESDAPSTSHIVSSFTCDRGSETSVSRALQCTAIQQPPLTQSGKPIMPLNLEPVKLSLWQGWDSKLWPSVCSNSELKLQPHGSLP